MGEVYRARDSRLSRDVAIKILPPSVTHDAERLARFRREAQVLAPFSQALASKTTNSDSPNCCPTVKASCSAREAG